MSRVLVIGEAIADFLPQDAQARRFECVLGGSGFNTSLALARLGVPCAYAWALSTDALGRRFETALREEGVDLAHLVRREAPSAVAIVQPAFESHGAMFALHLAGTAHEAPPDPAMLAGLAASHLHVASFAGTVGPASAGALALLGEYARRATSSFDPNIRASCLPPHAEAVALVEARVAAATLAKASEEDLGWLYPGLAPDQALARWLLLGARIAVCTRGGRGAVAMTARTMAEAVAPSVTVVDAVGAGDVFTAAFLAAMADSGVLGRPDLEPDAETLRAWLVFACRAATANCARPGCDPPRRAELAG